MDNQGGFASHYYLQPTANEISGVRKLYDVKNKKYVNSPLEQYVSKRERRR